MNKVAKLVQRLFMLEVELVRSNTFLIWLLLHIRYIVRSRREMVIKLFSFELIVRLNSPDLKVAFESLGSEFEKVREMYSTVNGHVILDVGGYIGTSALYFAKNFPDSRIFVLEPSSENAKVLRKNIARAGRDLVFINAALSCVQGQKSLKTRNTGQWGYTIVETPLDGENTQIIENVDTVSLDDLFTKYGISKIGLLKMDIEGGEFEILKGDTSWLDKCEVFVIELHERIVPGVTELFADVTKNRSNYSLGGEKIMSIRAK